MNPLTGGLITALITPFNSKGDIDYNSLDLLVKDQLKNGVEGFVVSGTTAESPNLSRSEVVDLFKFVKERVPSTFQMIVGAGTNSTSGTIENLKFYEALEPDAYLLVAPYYNKPSQRGLFEHFKAAAESTCRNIMLYDVPGRTIVDISVETTLKLSKIKNIIGTKDATGDLNKLKKLVELLDKDFVLLSGDDATSADFIKLGGHGVVSVLSHLVPKEMKASFKGEYDYSKLLELADLIFKEPNPCPVKSCLKEMSIISNDHVRLPLVSSTEPLKVKLVQALKNLECVG
jgi:4-hydroxy-tetrahydrodipicolinate synthase